MRDSMSEETKPDLEQVNVRIPKRIRMRLCSIAARSERTLQGVIRLALKRFIADQTKPGPKMEDGD